MPRILISISVYTPPSQTVYMEGDYFNPSGMVIKANYSDGTSQTILAYIYYPQVALTPSDTYVTISYQNKTVNQPITVNPYASLTIEQQPYKTIYMVGDQFEPYGLVVKYTTSAGSQYVNNYSFYPSGALSSYDHNIIISYNGLTAYVGVTVNNPPTTGYYPLQNIKDSNIGENPYFNVFDQSIRFISDSLSVNRDSYELSFNLVYHSATPYKLSLLVKGLPNRFKTNYHQFLIQDGVDTNNNPMYKYIDSDGYIHTFIYAFSDLYYSRLDDLSLVFYTENNTNYSKIVDTSGHELHFSSDGRLIKIKDGGDQNNIKHIVYTNGYLDYVYDARYPNTKITYQYNNQNVLTDVLFTYENALMKKSTFGYDQNSGFLTSVTEVSGASSRILYQFQYNVDSSETHSSFDRIEYINDLLNFKTTKITNSYSSSFYKDYLVTGFASGHFNASGIFVADKTFVRNGYNVRTDDFKTTNELMLRDENLKYLSFHIDKNAIITASFDGTSQSDYRTLYKETGVYLSIIGNKDTYVNQHRFYGVDTSLSISLPSEAISLLNAYKHFVLRMYVQLTNAISDNVIVSVSGNGIATSPVYLNTEQYERCQLVEIPLSRTANSISSLSITISIQKSDNTIVEIGDIYLDKKARTFLRFNDGQYSFDDVTAVKTFSDASEATPISTVTISTSSAFLINDFMNSVRHQHNPFKDLLTSNVKGAVNYNNGKDLETYSYSFALYAGNTKIYSSISSNNSDLSSGAWYFETISFDDKFKEKTFYRFIDIPNSSGFYEIITQTCLINNNTDIVIKQETKRYDWSNHLVSVETINNESNDPITSDTCYEYFTNGELKKVTITSDNETIIAYDATQNNNGYISNTTVDRDSVDVTYDGYLVDTLVHVPMTLTPSYQCSKSLSYDAYKDNQTHSLFYQDTTLVGQNSVSFNYTLGSANIYSNNALLYNYVFNKANNTLTVKRYCNYSYESVFSKEITSSLAKETYYGNNGNTIVSYEYDDYGRLTSQKVNNTEVVSYSYETGFIESSRAARPTSIVETHPGGNRTTSISYNQNDYESLTTLDSGAFTIKKRSDGNVEYGFLDNTSYLYEQSLIKLDVKANGTRNISFSTLYYHDGFNRLYKKTKTTNQNVVILEDIIYYYSETLRPSYYYHNDSPNEVVEEYYGYDTFGNVNSISTTFKDTNGNNIIDASYTRSFEYDGFNRLISESKNGNVVRTYTYSNEKMSSFGSSTLSYNNKGQISSCGNISYTYDKYGNRLTKTISTNTDHYYWEKGKLLASVEIDNHDIDFLYDHRGVRFKKDTEQETVTFYYDEQLLIAEDHVGKTYVDSNNMQVTAPSYKLRFFYHKDGTPNGLRLMYVANNRIVTKDYNYIFSPLNEIIGLSSFNNNNAVILEAMYIYDAWGNHIVMDNTGLENNDPTFIGNRNPLRYKGYYYDKETNLYYLLSRYYDPSIGHFISPDDFSYLDINSISGFNLYSYSNNNPETNYDPDGHLGLFIFLTLGYWISLGAVVTIHDLVSLSKLEITPNQNDGNVEIKNSYLIFTPWMQYFFAFSLNHFDNKTKSIIQGSTFGVQFEWFLHNVYYCFTHASNAKDLDVGSTIFADVGHGYKGDLMKIAYMIVRALTYSWLHAMYELMIEGGWKR